MFMCKLNNSDNSNIKILQQIKVNVWERIAPEKNNMYSTASMK